MKILLTGHKGYIGSVAAPLLRSAGHFVVGLKTTSLRVAISGSPNRDTRDRQRHPRRHESGISKVSKRWCIWLPFPMIRGNVRIPASRMKLITRLL